MLTFFHIGGKRFAQMNEKQKQEILFVLLPWETGVLRAYRASPPIPARLAVTLPDLQLAVHPCEPGLAGTGVASLSCVHAGGSIATGLVVGAVVQICSETPGGHVKRSFAR